MNQALSDVIQLLELERIEENIFRGPSHDIGSPQVFGGQVLGQALSAASYTVAPDHAPHSLHAYFLRRGDYNAPIVYEVDRSRDGRSFSNRRVVAIQHGRPILNLAASFQVHEEGLSHQAAMPDVPGPEGLERNIDIHQSIMDKVPEKMRRFLAHQPPFEFRPVVPPNFLNPEKREPIKHVWMRAWEELPQKPSLHCNLLAYVSDYELIGTATLPHGLRFDKGQVQIASLDHAMWFHQPVAVDQWLLYSMDSPRTAGGRGLARGQIFTQDGILVASTAQEGVIRVWKQE